MPCAVKETTAVSATASSKRHHTNPPPDLNAEESEWAWSAPREGESINLGAIFRLAPGLLEVPSHLSGSAELRVDDTATGGLEFDQKCPLIEDSDRRVRNLSLRGVIGSSVAGGLSTMVVQRLPKPRTRVRSP